jgi:hypothetical protein
MSEQKLPRLEPGLHQGNLLNAAVRRDIADLNRLYLDHALDPHYGADAWFSVPARAADRLRQGSVAGLERAAQCPFTLFEFVLPDPVEAAAWPTDAVADRAERSPCDPAWTETRRAFGVTALAVVRRMAEGVPMAPRIAFGLPPSLEARLHAMSLSESYRVAAWPGLIRPRWSGHERFWAVLSALVADESAVHWAYAAGVCLLSPCERRDGAVTGGLARRPARAPPWAVLPKAPDVPC